jgi:uncharacterized membrane protein
MTSSELKQAAKFALKDNFIAKMLLFIVPLLISILTGRLSNSSSMTIQHRLDESNIDFSGTPEALSNIDWGLVLAIVIPIIIVSIVISFFTPALTLVTQLIMFLLVLIPVVGWAIAIYLGFSWSQATYVLYDKLKNNQYQGIWDVLNTSKEMMKGYKAKYFLFNLTFIGWYILSVFFFGIPQIWTMPYTEMSMVAFYEARIQDRL